MAFSGLFDVGGQQLVTPPIRGRTDELKAIGASVSAAAGGHGGVRTLFGEAFEYRQAVPFFSPFMTSCPAGSPGLF